MEAERQRGEISCPWCGAFSQPSPICELCGSPMSDGTSARVTEAVTILSGSEPVAVEVPANVVNLPVDPVSVAMVEAAPQPLALRQVVSAQGRWRARLTRKPRMNISRRDMSTRYRRSLDVRWLIEAVNS